MVQKEIHLMLNRKYKNLFPTVTTFVTCSSHLLIFLGSLYCKQYGPRSDCSIRSSLIRVHSVCLHNKIYSEVNLNKHLYAADVKSRQHFRNKYSGRIRVQQTAWVFHALINDNI